VTIYVDCPSCAKLRPWGRPELVIKGEKRCRYCAAKPVKKTRRKYSRIAIGQKSNF
jgi:hypothetical protein